MLVEKLVILLRNEILSILDKLIIKFFHFEELLKNLRLCILVLLLNQLKILDLDKLRIVFLYFVTVLELIKLAIA